MLIFLLTLSYGVLALYLFMTGKVSYYIHPDFSWYVVIAGIVLILLALSNGWTITQSSKGSFKNLLTYPNNLQKFVGLGLLFLPLIAILVFPPRLLSAATAQNRLTVSYGDSGLSREVKKVSPFVINSEKRLFIDWIRLFSQYPQVERYEGMKANIKGFVLPYKDLPSGYVYLAQFIISCCAADARPVTIPLHFDPQQHQITSDQWIEVKGTFTIDTLNGQTQPILEVEQITPTNIPDEPYAL